MKCPRCKTDYVCPCKNCADTFSKGKVTWIRHDDDTESCPKCGLRKHLDQWLDVEWQQYKSKERTMKKSVRDILEKFNFEYNKSFGSASAYVDREIAIDLALSSLQELVFAKKKKEKKELLAEGIRDYEIIGWNSAIDHIAKKIKEPL